MKFSLWEEIEDITAIYELKCRNKWLKEYERMFFGNRWKDMSLPGVDNWPQICLDISYHPNTYSNALKIILALMRLADKACKMLDGLFWHGRKQIKVYNITLFHAL